MRSWNPKGEYPDYLVTDQRRGTKSESPTNSKRKNEFDVLSAVHTAEYSTLINTPHPQDLNPAHKFTVELDNDGYTLEKYTLYEKYQRIVHNESKLEITPSQFERFLCSTPFREKLYIDKNTGEQRKTGSFHQLYRVDGVLVAVAVLDLLPDTISSVYFIYDPDSMGKFGMGKVSALREVAMCIEGGYQYYGLGIFSCCLVVIVGLFAFGCEKLRYKAEVQPNELLDPVHPSISKLMIPAIISVVPLRKIQTPFRSRRKIYHILHTRTIPPQFSPGRRYSLPHTSPRNSSVRSGHRQRNIRLIRGKYACGLVTGEGGFC
jgi:arginyl-tRNA--protein-N-Asp/Glu arginylyltransferase